ncbi:MAG TPA: YraN family protein [Jatrophihabitans sp.]|nr:YraN family protein [Jatrophihabitans sp.]
MRVKDAVGRFGEQVAVEHLTERGLLVLDRNWRCRDGELDVVALDGRALVFVEVKTRSSLAFGGPAEAVDQRKAARIRRLALRWIEARRTSGDPTFWESVRFDVLCVVRQRSGGPHIVHLVGAF